MAKLLSVLFISEYTLLNVVHGSVHALVVFFWSEKFEILLFRYLYVYAQTVGIESRLVYQLATGAGNAFQMDVTVEPVYESQVFGNPHEAFHRIIGIPHYTRTQKKPFDVVAPIELDGEVHQFAHRERGTGNVVAAAVDAVGTIVNAIIGEHDFE